MTCSFQGRAWWVAAGNEHGEVVLVPGRYPHVQLLEKDPKWQNRVRTPDLLPGDLPGGEVAGAGCLLDRGP